MASRRTPDSSRTSKPAVTKPPKGPAAVETKKPVDMKPASAGAAATRADVDQSAAPKAAPAQPKRAARPAKPAAAPAKAHVSEETRRAMIAESAYLRAERRGFAPGNEVEDWVAAEKEVDALLNATTGSGPQ